MQFFLDMLKIMLIFAVIFD